MTKKKIVKKDKKGTTLFGNPQDKVVINPEEKKLRNESIRIKREKSLQEKANKSRN